MEGWAFITDRTQNPFWRLLGRRVAHAPGLADVGGRRVVGVVIEVLGRVRVLPVRGLAHEQMDSDADAAPIPHQSVQASKLVALRWRQRLCCSGASARAAALAHESEVGMRIAANEPLSDHCDWGNKARCGGASPEAIARNSPRGTVQRGRTKGAWKRFQGAS